MGNDCARLPMLRAWMAWPMQASLPCGHGEQSTSRGKESAMNSTRKQVAVVVGATSKWQADGRNTQLAHGKVLGRAPILFHLDCTSAQRRRNANKALQLTASSVRSCLAPASGGGSPLALDARAGEKEAKRELEISCTVSESRSSILWVTSFVLLKLLKVAGIANGSQYPRPISLVLL